MRLRADHLTLSRIVLLPVPVLMLHGGRPAWTLSALIGFALLGLTDILDGPLARKQGSSRLGPLLDTLSDRVFLCVIWCALAEFRAVPIWFASILLAREYLVVSVRGLLGNDTEPWRPGKLKTTVQNLGAGFLLLMRLSPHGPWFAWFAVAGFLLSAFLGVRLALRPAVAGRRRRTWDWRAGWGCALMGGLLAARTAGVEIARGGIMFVIGAVTWVSAIQLFVRSRNRIRVGLRRGGWPAYAPVALSPVIAGIWTQVLEFEGAPALAASAVLATRLASMALANEERARLRTPGQGNVASRSLGWISDAILVLVGLAAWRAARASSPVLLLIAAALALVAMELVLSVRNLYQAMNSTVKEGIARQ
ncbi:MAG: CDP-alcohol phosphatidyltransferase family protein [Candidatus Eisenbacteria bacterium]|nr:CDP-alcohol phosphatidyltransferase family protein [Candidatus Eisenbacteria bacterium]